MKITKRERDVIMLLLAGESNKRIAKQLGISPYTVRDHISKMLKRYNLNNRVDLAMLALKVQETRSGRSVDDSV